MENSRDSNPPEGNITELLQEVSEGLESVYQDDIVFIHAGHLQQILAEAVEIIKVTPDLVAKASGTDEMSPQTVGYLLGVYEIARLIDIILRALQIKHADDVTLPTDDLMDDLSEFMKREGNE